MSQNKSKAIIDKYTLELLGNDLKQKQDAYYIIFRLLIETGMPLSEVCSMRICDINKNAVTFSPIHKGYLRTEQLSEKLQSEIKEYIGNRSGEELAFPSKSNPNKPFFIRSFQNALFESSNLLGIDPPVTATALKKTFIYNLFIKTRDTKKIYKITGVRSNVQLYEFLGIEAPPQKNDTGKQILANSPYNILVGENLPEKTKANLTEVFDNIIENLKAPGELSYAYCSEALVLISSIEKALARFENVTEDDKLLKGIYKKSGDTRENVNPSSV